MNFILILVLTLLNAVFAMSEMALTASRKARLAALAEAGDKGAEAALALMERPTHFLSTVQVGITSIGMLNGIVGEAAFSEGVSIFLQGWGATPKVAGVAATTIVVVVITFITLIFGELVPKRIGQLHPETVARLMARPMRAVASAAAPFVKLLAACTQGVLKLLNIDTNAVRSVTEEEITASLEEGVDAGLIEQHEHQMVRNVFHLDDRPLTSLMIPRMDIVWLSAQLSVAEALQHIGQVISKNTANGGHSWYPVCRGGLDHVVGVISVAQLLAANEVAEREASQAIESIESIALPASFVPETLTGMEVLEQFRKRSERIVMVVDEYGEVQGLMTPRDMLEAITGELRPNAQVDAWATHREDGSWLLDGLMPLAELRARLEIKQLPDEDKGRYNTVAGLLMSVSGHLPAVGERIACEGWEFEVLELEGKRIDKLQARQLPEDEA
ncbi:MAG: hemolysin family protein [Burkholderiaceae bacterium]|nr:hemolysin family protein [Burkholderiaceae bacterium]